MMMTARSTVTTPTQATSDTNTVDRVAVSLATGCSFSLIRSNWRDASSTSPLLVASSSAADESFRPTRHHTQRQSRHQCCRSVSRVRVIRASHQTVSDHTLRRRFSNTRQFRFLTACRRLEKSVLPSIFHTVSNEKNDI